MKSIEGYKTGELIYESNHSLIYRAIRLADQCPVIFKLLKQDFPSADALLKYRQEYALISHLDLPHVITAYDLIQQGHSLLIVLEDFSATALNECIPVGGFSIAEFLPLAIQMTEALGGVHSQDLIHRDINPSNIVYNREKKLAKIIDFGNATRLTREQTGFKSTGKLEGTFAYMSPEQTGRMNRAVDYRTDLYSLGGTFYTMLCGHSPFMGDDVMVLVHSHLAKLVTPLTVIDSSIPSMLADIIGKLLEKNAENRYQSAWGCQHDLQHCWQHWQASQSVPEIELAGKDQSHQFHLPQKLYGRDKEIALLLAGYDRARQEKPEMLLVAGYSGIGKSVLVQEVYQPLTQHNGFYISGKFDQLQRNTPYTAVLTAMTELLEYVLSQEDINYWKDNILKAVGNRGQVLIDVLPELVLVLGAQPKVPELGAAEAQVRFNLVFQSFIHVFSRKQHPLVWFLDDLQWADLASLQLIEVLMTDSSPQALLLIGAYRDNEVQAGHPLLMCLEKIAQADARVSTLLLDNLSASDVLNLVDESLKCSLNQGQFLAQLLLEKTAGNPFFLTQLLQNFYQQKYLQFNPEYRRWIWDDQQLQDADISTNVVDFLLQKLQCLPSKTQSILQLAACLGSRFDLQLLALVTEKQQISCVNSLWPAIQDGLICPLSSAWDCRNELDLTLNQVNFKFLHDRVQQAAYALIPDSVVAEKHLKIGRLLSKQLSNPEDNNEESLFSAVDHLNRAVDLLTDKKEHQLLLRLNLSAGHKAKKAAAYAASFNYFQAGMALLPEHSWQNEHDLTFELYRHASECAFLSGDFDQAEGLFDCILAQTSVFLEQCEVHIMRLALYDNMGRYADNINIAIGALDSLGVHIPLEPESIEVAFQSELTVYRQALKKHPIKTLIDLPVMENQKIEASLNLLMNMTGPVYFTNQNLLALVCLKMVNLSIAHGNSQVAPHGYAFWGIVAGVALDEYQDGHEFGQLALNLLEQLPDSQLHCKVYNLVGALIMHWREPMRYCGPILEKGFQAGVETGDVYTSYITYHLILQRLVMGNSIPDVMRLSETYHEFLQQNRNAVFVAVQKTYQQVMLALQGKTQSLISLNNEQYQELSFLKLMEENQFIPGIAMYRIFKIQLCYLDRDYERAFEYASASNETVVYVSGITNQFEHFFYTGLTLVALLIEGNENNKITLTEQLQLCVQKITFWANSCPENYSHKLLLLQAEIARMKGEWQTAMQAYDQAIALAKEHEFRPVEALANELSAQFWFNQGKQDFSLLYAQQAHYIYSIWGATAKVTDLQVKYPGLIEEKVKESRSLSGSLREESIILDDAGTLDLMTMLKVAQSISGEIVLSSVLQKIMHYVMENAGAEQGALLLLNEYNEWVIEAEKVSPHAPVHVLNGKPFLHSRSVSVGVVNYVLRTQKSIVLYDAVHSKLFGQDAYIKDKQPLSVLCTPLINQGRILAVLYLENNQLHGAMTDNNLQTINLLSAQMAISIENAQLYAHLEENVRQRTEHIEAQNQDLEKTLLTLQVTQKELLHTEKMAALGQLVAGIAHEINTPLGAISASIDHIEQSLQRSLQAFPDILLQITVQQREDFFAMLRIASKELPRLSSREKRDMRLEITNELQQSEFENPLFIADTLVDMGFYELDDVCLPLISEYPLVLKILQDISIQIRSTYTIQQAVAKTSKIVFALKNYARQNPEEHKVMTDIRDNIETVLTLYASQVSQGVELITEYNIDALVPCYADELNQVWVNLIHNALQAMNNQGRLMIKVDKKGAMVSVQISDCGCGIPKDIQGQIFEPFFTTKSVGEGSGLGLDIVKRIIDKHAGSISFSSQPGETVFSVLLPLEGKLKEIQ